MQKTTKPNPRRKIRVMELFAGVGGFHIGLSAANGPATKGGPRYEVVWSNQWEPGESKQWASKVYVERFGAEGHSNVDITKVATRDMPEADLLVGGFPCQDYSVARTLNQAHGIIGKKGVLWWEIHRIVDEKRPSMLLLENVDRMLKSPATRRGRDFAIILSALNDLGYVVEWKVINAADYGFPQRRRRVFILAYARGTAMAAAVEREGPWAWLTRSGVLASALPSKFADSEPLFPIEVGTDPAAASSGFNISGARLSPFQNAGVAIAGKVYTAHGVPVFRGRKKVLRDVLVEKKHPIPPEYYVPDAELPKWKYLKGAKSLERIGKSGAIYSYDEGSMAFPDPTDKPSRTIVTGEGGRTPSRFKHIIQVGNRHRRLLPVELEALNGFPKNHTLIEGIPDGRRAFFMGNALVTGIVTRIAKTLLKHGAWESAAHPIADHGKGARTRKQVDGAGGDKAVPKRARNRVAKA